MYGKKCDRGEYLSAGSFCILFHYQFGARICTPNIPATELKCFERKREKYRLIWPHWGELYRIAIFVNKSRKKMQSSILLVINNGSREMKRARNRQRFVIEFTNLCPNRKSNIALLYIAAALIRWWMKKEERISCTVLLSYGIACSLPPDSPVYHDEYIFE